MRTPIIALVIGSVLMFATGQAAFAQQVAGCTVLGVAAHENRIHIRCAEKPPGVPLTASDLAAGKTNPFYYAVEISSPLASRASDIGLWALTNHKTVDVFFLPNANANPPGCNVNDCRRLTGIEALR